MVGTRCLASPQILYPHKFYLTGLYFHKFITPADFLFKRQTHPDGGPFPDLGMHHVNLSFVVFFHDPFYQ